MGHIRKDNFDDGRFGNGSFFGHKLQFSQYVDIKCDFHIKFPPLIIF